MIASVPRRAWAASLVVVAWSSAAAAQPPPPLAPLPAPSAAAPAVTSPAATDTPGAAPTVPAEAPPPAPPPAVAPPPPVVYVAPDRPPHAPRYSLWLGGRVGVLAYSGGLYINNVNAQTVETTGNFVRPGLGLELDVGARLYKRYIPYIGLEIGLVGAGRRFDGTSAKANTAFLGLGFRYLAGDVDAVAFASDLSFGVRRFEVSNAGGTWSTTSIEIFRLGLGAEIRISNSFAVSPMLTISGGKPTDVSGSTSFAPNQGDGQFGPPFTGSSSIPVSAQMSYYAIVLGCGGHFDLFGD